MEYAELERRLGEQIATLAPPGASAETRGMVITALASMLGIYLAGDLRSRSRETYARQVAEVVDRIRGVAELQGVQLRSILGGGGRAEPPLYREQSLGLPPSDMLDPDGEKHILLSSLQAVIHVDEVEWWRLPGWPAARARLTPAGLDVVVEADEEAPASYWTVTRVAAI